ncbi:hypothetical protein [Sodalis praecaptivus]|uniref:hypothetical protein n=1 Tax=Sodalis praecaptivus TaxID=1239307 RepID=UPI0031F82399
MKRTFNVLLAIEQALSSLLGVKVYQLLGTQHDDDFVTVQQISDRPVEGGLVSTGLVIGRYQLSFVSRRFERVLAMDNQVWAAWRTVVHGDIGGCPVQYIERSRLYDSLEGKWYRRVRDYLIYHPEIAS